ncbi:MAG: hypothetical protein AAGA73_12520 [Pseudomonadota bacterium]
MVGGAGPWGGGTTNSTPTVDASDRKFYVMASDRGNKKALEDFDRALNKQREVTPPPPPRAVTTTAPEPRPPFRPETTPQYTPNSPTVFPPNLDNQGPFDFGVGNPFLPNPIFHGPSAPTSDPAADNGNDDPHPEPNVSKAQELQTDLSEADDRVGRLIAGRGSIMAIENAAQQRDELRAEIEAYQEDLEKKLEDADARVERLTQDRSPIPAIEHAAEERDALRAELDVFPGPTRLEELEGELDEAEERVDRLVAGRGSIAAIENAAQERDAVKDAIADESHAALLRSGNQYYRITNPETGAAYTRDEASALRDEAVSQAEGRILAAAADGRDPDRLHIINPLTGTEYTDAEINAIVGAANDRVEAADEAANDIEQISEAWLEHNQELNYHIQSSGEAMTPDQLIAATQNYIDNQSEAWRQERAELEADLADAGERYLTAIDGNQFQGGVYGGFDDRNDADTQFAIGLALQSDPSLIGEVNAEGLINTFNEENGKRIGAAHFQHEVIDSFAELDGDSPNAQRAAADGIDSLRSQTFADVFTEDGNLDDWNDTLDALEATIDADDPIASHNALVAELSSSSSIDDESAIAYSLQSLSLAAAVGNDQDFSAGLEISPASGAAYTNDVLTLTVGYPVAALNLESAGFFSTTANGASKLIGVASVGLAAYNLADSAANGDAAGLFFNSGALAGGIIAFAAPGVGTAISLAFSGLSLAHSQAKKVELSNQYTTLDPDTRQNAIDFITHADLSEGAAIELLDRSGEGHSAIPVFIRYGEEQGWTLKETLEYIDRRHEIGDLGHKRDYYHELLDEVNGDVSAIDADLEAPIAPAPHSTQPPFGSSTIDSGTGGVSYPPSLEPSHGYGTTAG